ncbi:hypothetical protein Droror1_Dr00001477 [Drosera rotundifolia]
MSPPPWCHHVVAIPFPFGTHATPLLALTARLAAASPSTRFTFLINTPHPNSTTLPHNIIPHEIHVRYNGDRGGGVEGMIGVFMREAETSMGKWVNEVEQESGVRVEGLICDAFMWFCGRVGEELGVWWIGVWTSGVGSLCAHLETDLFRDRIIGVGGPEGKEDEQLDFIPGFSPIRARDLPDGVITGDLNSPFSQMLYNMALALPKAAAVAINSFEDLQHDISSYIMSSKLPKLLHIGPLSLTSPHKTPQSDDHQCILWLDQHEQNSVAYISFGSVCTPPPSEIIALAEALDATGVSFLWSMNDNAKAKLPQWLMEKANEKGKVVPWAPQLPILGHRSVSVFVTHGGWNSVSEGIISGVPMICRPFFGDQMLNRRTIESVWRIGVGVERGVFTKDSVVRAIEKVMRSDVGKTMRKNVMFLKERAKEAAKVDGSSDRNLKSLIKIIAVPDSKDEIMTRIEKDGRSSREEETSRGYKRSDSQQSQMKTGKLAHCHEVPIVYTMP